jgi:hypothetical protein
LELLGRDTSLGRGHEKGSIEPRTKWSIGLMEDSVSGRRDTSTTELARVEFRACPLVMFGYFSTLLTKYAVRIASLKKGVQASIFVRESLIKVFNSVGFHILSPILFYTYTIAQYLRNVKG